MVGSIEYQMIRPQKVNSQVPHNKHYSFFNKDWRNNRTCIETCACVVFGVLRQVNNGYRIRRVDPSLDRWNPSFIKLWKQSLRYVGMRAPRYIIEREVSHGDCMMAHVELNKRKSLLKETESIRELKH